MKLISIFIFVLPLIFLGLAGYVPMAMAQSPGTFTPTGGLNTGRFHHTATLLPNGKVLIAGGSYSHPTIPIDAFFDFLASAELYDPSAGRFTPAGNMNQHRGGHTATLLADGRVLLAGGFYTSSAELYHPATGTFTATGDMITARQNHTATLLNDGTVLITGGYTTKSAELYDPSSGIFTATGDMNKPRWAGVATLLSDGKVLVSGGIYCGSDGVYVCPGSDAAEIYDPATGSFTLVGEGANPSERTPVEATLLTSGKVLEIFGPSCDCANVYDAELYAPLTNTFTATGHMTTYRSLFAGFDTAITPLSDGTVFIVGGNSTELYNPASGAFTPAGRMTWTRGGHTATLLPDGTVLIAGGQDFVGNFAGATAEIYHPAALVPAPVLFSLSGDGHGQGAVLHANTPRVASSSDPAVAGEYLEIYLTGLADGSVIPPQVAIGARMAEVLYFGKSGYAGLNQMNVRVPSGVTPGPAVPVRLTYMGRPSNEVTIGVQ